MSGGPDDGAGPDPLSLLRHDIRNALASTIAGLRLLDAEPLSARARGVLEGTRVAAELTASLAEELLARARRLDPAPDDGHPPDAATDLHRVLADESACARALAEHRGVAIDLSIAPGTPRLVGVEGLALRRIVANALGNAVDHARTSIALRARLDDGRGILVSVEDDGPGFDPAVLRRVFEARGRGDGSAGTGLGLHIAAENARWIGASVRAENRPEGGAVFRLLLPAASHDGREPDGRLPDLAGWRVLVADDNATLRTLVGAMMGRMGATCAGAGDGVEALNWLARERFDLVFVDLEMPLLDGRDVIRAQRRREGRGIAPRTPLVVMTAHAELTAAEVEGADGLVAKPLPELATFGRMLAGILEAAPAGQPWRPDEADPLDVATLRELLAAAGPAEAPAMLEGMRGDLLAAERGLAEALPADDRAAIRRHCHVLVSLAGTVGGLPTLAAARALGALARDDAPRTEVEPAGARCLDRLRALRAEVVAVGRPASGSG